jgi:outer membrane autotransporter protein
VSAGIYLQRYAGSDPDFTVGETDVSLTNIMAEVTYYANMADENTFWVSGLLGVTQSSTEFSNNLVADNDQSDTAFGFAAGYHFMVAPNFSLSPQITYIYTDTDTSSYSEFSGLANLTIWL